MQRDELEMFLGKYVKADLKNDFIYRGELLKIFETSILIKDFKSGKIIVNMEQIRTLSEVVEAEKIGGGNKEDNGRG